MEQRDLRTYQTDRRQIFRIVDMQMKTFNLVFVSRSVKGRCHGNQFQAPDLPKSATPNKFVGVKIAPAFPY